MWSVWVELVLLSYRADVTIAMQQQNSNVTLPINRIRLSMRRYINVRHSLSMTRVMFPASCSTGQRLAWGLACRSWRQKCHQLRPPPYISPCGCRVLVVFNKTIVRI
ncbi:hypothetical protein BV22DRAFT_642246 [Leucogyrophana mollusca]|uniref:Uncharacterized protein n=1 Tax=Leucogyrophana mollusca TaxID=85980 RepID=A0ACB8BBI2_9AGAM|nr:hypothetical protein BV22DRAFT_642246 [Leucogyrophana mollusca]